MGSGGKIASVIMIIVGIASAVIGSILTVYPVQQPRYVYGFYIGTVTTYPYQGIGSVMTTLGVLVFILGIVLLAIMLVTSRRTPVNPQHSMIVTYQHTPNPSGTVLYCQNCGAASEVGSFCKYCGAKIG